MIRKNKHILSVRLVRAFTLLELLTAMAILAILAALVISAARRGIESANAAKCLSHLRQIGVTANLYTADNDGRFPAIDYWRANPPGSMREWRVWYTELQPYCQGKFPGESILRCPSTKSVQTYSMNMHLCEFRLLQISRPSQTVFLVEDTAGGWTSVRASEAAMNGINPIQHRHNEKANFLFVGGNVSPMTYQETVARENFWEPVR